MNKQKIHGAFYQIPSDDDLTKANVKELIESVSDTDSDYLRVIEVEGDHAIAYGVLNVSTINSPYLMILIVMIVFL